MEKIWLSTPTTHGEEQIFIKEAFDTNWVAPLGKNVTEFENEISAYLGCKAAAAMTAGTHALHMAFKLAGIGRGDIVLGPYLCGNCQSGQLSWRRAGLYRF